MSGPGNSGSGLGRAVNAQRKDFYSGRYRELLDSPAYGNESHRAYSGFNQLAKCIELFHIVNQVLSALLFRYAEISECASLLISVNDFPGLYNAEPMPNPLMPCCI